MKPPCPIQFPACLLCNWLVGFCLWHVCFCSWLVLLRFSKPAAEDWDTSCLVGKCPSQVGWDQDRPVSFQVWLVSVNGLPGDGVLLKSFSRQDGNIIGQDVKYNWQAIEIYNRTVFRLAEPQSGYRVGVGRWNIKHIWYFAIHCNKLGKCSQS